MNYNFDEIINRNGTDSVKWDAVESRWGRNDLIPMWWLIWISVRLLL